MSKKKAKQNSQRGTYALCITTGLIVGVGLGSMLGNVLASTLFGVIVGAAAGYFFNHGKKKQKP